MSKITNAGSKYYVCAAPQIAPVAQAALAALTYVEIGFVGNRGDIGADDNIVNYSTMGETVVSKAKGQKDAGSFEIECAFEAADPGQIIMRTACANKSKYAVKIEYDDAPTSGASPKKTVKYVLALIGGPTHSGGGVDDFVVESYSVNVTDQDVITVPASAS
ncbi:hypothetical protein V5F53_10970 [Xanthobacter sp. V4C-4]|uniref:hypothetical protein n=1 Tax=Xanthobacter cornucopiae TaxID=3119924 RepID=UPI0037289D68